MEMHFGERNVLNFCSNFSDAYSVGSIWHQVFGLSNGLAWRQVIVRTSDILETIGYMKPWSCYIEISDLALLLLILSIT